MPKNKKALDRGDYIKEAEGLSKRELAQEVQKDIDEKHAAYFASDLAPELDPSSPDFDPSARWAACIDAARALQDTMISHKVDLSNTNTQEIIDNNRALWEEAKEPLQFFAQQIRAAAVAIGKALKESDATQPKYNDEFVQNVAALEPYLVIELSNASADNPKFLDFTIWDIYAGGFDDAGQPIKDSVFASIIEQAQERKRIYEDLETHTAIVEALGGKIEQLESEAEENKITVKAAQKIDFGVDKISNLIFGLNTKFVPDKQQWIDTLGEGKHPIMLSTDFSGVDKLAFKTSRKLDFYDEFVTAAAAALSANNGIFSLTQMCKEMGLSNNKRTRQEIRQSMEKQRVTIIHIDNLDESENSEYPHFKHADGAALPYELVTASFNGTISDGIQLLKEPLLLRFAKGRNQFASIRREVLNVKTVRKNHRNINIIIFLAKRISRIKNGSGQPTILYESLYATFDIKATHKSDFLGVVEKILLHFKNENFITNYTKDARSFHVFVAKEIEEKGDLQTREIQQGTMDNTGKTMDNTGKTMDNTGKRHPHKPA